MRDELALECLVKTLCIGFLSASAAGSERRRSEPGIFILHLAIWAFLSSPTHALLAWLGSRPSFRGPLLLCPPGVWPSTRLWDAPFSSRLPSGVPCPRASFLWPVGIGPGASGFFSRHWTEEVRESDVRADLTPGQKGCKGGRRHPCLIVPSTLLWARFSGPSRWPRVCGCHLPPLPPSPPPPRLTYIDFPGS